MELQASKQFFPILSGGEFYPISLGGILLAFYTSNQKYFTNEELQYETKLTKEEVNYGLKLLIHFGEVSKKQKNTLSTAYFSFNAKGSLKKIKNTIEKSRDLLNLFEQILDARDASNQQLNNYIKETIIFYSEVLDYTELKAYEHFNTKKNN